MLRGFVKVPMYWTVFVCLCMHWNKLVRGDREFSNEPYFGLRLSWFRWLIKTKAMSFYLYSDNPDIWGCLIHMCAGN